MSDAALWWLFAAIGILSVTALAMWIEERKQAKERGGRRANQ